jgi:hypothetical protein
MALEGQLSDFNISEIFQLIASQQKSGFLNLESQQKMVFIFDKGVLISTRDRRSGSNDPLERYLRAYGFFDDAQWDHIEYIKNNSSLDLTEILVSEGLLETEELAKALRGVAQEMTFEGMKLKRGRYHFSSTRGTPQGIRGRVDLNVQGLLMEAARRLDDEPRLAELFSSPVMTFHRGKKSPESEELTPTDSRILKLALDGEPLGKIICQAQVDSFATRERLKLFCEMKYLEAVGAGESTDANQGPSTSSSPPERGTGLKSRFLTGTLTILLLGLGVVRRRGGAGREIRLSGGGHATGCRRGGDPDHRQRNPAPADTGHRLSSRGLVPLSLRPVPGRPLLAGQGGDDDAESLSHPGAVGLDLPLAGR